MTCWVAATSASLARADVRRCVENLVRIVEAVKVGGDLAKIIRYIMRLKSFGGGDNHIGESG